MVATTALTRVSPATSPQQARTPLKAQAKRPLLSLPPKSQAKFNFDMIFIALLAGEMMTNVVVLLMCAAIIFKNLATKKIPSQQIVELDKPAENKLVRAGKKLLMLTPLIGATIIDGFNPGALTGEAIVPYGFWLTVHLQSRARDK